MIKLSQISHAVKTCTSTKEAVYMQAVHDTIAARCPELLKESQVPNPVGGVPGAAQAMQPGNPMPQSQQSAQRSMGMASTMQQPLGVGGQAAALHPNPTNVGEGEQSVIAPTVGGTPPVPPGKPVN